MTIDLMDPRVPVRDDDLVASVIQQQIRMAQLPDWVFFARAVKFYELEVEKRSEVVQQYLSLFEHAVGASPYDFIMGGIVVAIPELVRCPEQQASGWQPVLPSEQRIKPIERRVAQSYEMVRSGTVDDIRNSILRYEKGLSYGDWNLISLYRYPLVKFPDKGTFIVNLTALGRSLFDGVRHSILTAALERRLDPRFCDIKRLGGLYGELFERYVLSVIESAFPGRVIKIPESEFPGNADCLICFPGSVVVVEIKSGHFAVANHHKLMTIEERVSEIKDIGFSKATRQIQGTIRNLRDYTLKFPSLPHYDWTITPVIPLIVTEDRFPLFPLAWRYLYQEIEKPLVLLQDGSGPIGPLRMMTLDEVEIVPSLSTKTDFSSLLLNWGRDSGLREHPFTNYLHSCGHAWSNGFMLNCWKAAMRLLATTVGLDTQKL